MHKRTHEIYLSEEISSISISVIHLRLHIHIYSYVSKVLLVFEYAISNLLPVKGVLTGPVFEDKGMKMSSV